MSFAGLLSSLRSGAKAAQQAASAGRLRRPLSASVSRMPRIDREAWADKASVLVFIAGTVAEAKRAEAALAAAGVDYYVDAAEYVQGMGFPIIGTYTGLGFYVLKGQASYAHQLLETAQLRSGIIAADA